MIYFTKHGKQISIENLMPEMEQLLVDYLLKLSPASASRFGPHPFDLPAVKDLFTAKGLHRGYIASFVESPGIIAYALIKNGILEWDRARLHSYGLTLDDHTDCTYAPSVADCWQSVGIGNLMLEHIRKDLASQGKSRIILWGGVQATNEKAVAFYRKNGFRQLGVFEHNGQNLDMILEQL
jgi:ribosomal protein S18 acetylase RimI-like enzyme